MAIPADQALMAEVGLSAFAGRVPEHVRDKVEIRFRRERSSYILFSWRPRLMEPHEWTEFPVAKFTYVATRKKWKLLRMDRYSKWRSYEWADKDADIERLLQEVDHDPYCFFWG